MSFWFKILLLIFVFVAILVWLQISLFAPETWLLILSALAFSLFAYRLMAVYTLIIITADFFKKEGKVSDLAKIAQKTGKNTEEIQQLPLSVSLGLVLTALEPFRYSFYLGFIVILLLTLAYNFIPNLADVKIYTEAIFWGTALTAYVTWSLENFAESSIADVAELERQQSPSETSQSV